MPPITPRSSDPDRTGSSPRIPLGWAAALLVTGATAAYGMVSTLSLRAELEELKSSVVKAPSQVFPAGEVFLPEKDDKLGKGSLEERLATVESRIQKHDRAIEILAVQAARSVSGGGGDVLDSDGTVTEEMAEALRAFEESERQRKRRERLEKRSAEAIALLAEKHAKFVADHRLSPEIDRALSDLEFEVQENARAIAESVMNGELRWRDVRPEIQATFEDTVARLTSILGEDLAQDYLDRLEVDFPMLRRLRNGGWERDGDGREDR